MNILRTALWGRFILVPVLLAGCEDFQSRHEAGVCYQDDHLTDNSNCGCTGPCLSSQRCIGGLCTEVPASCGDGTCSPDKGESAEVCPEDCQGTASDVAAEDASSPEDARPAHDVLGQEVQRGPPCGDGICDTAFGENGIECPADCPQEADTLPLDVSSMDSI